MTTKDRLLDAAMRLFGEQGYAATSIAQIEAAAGLSPGSGALYKHFSSKQALLTAGLDRLLSAEAAVAPPAESAADGDLSDQVTALARAGLRRLDHDRDLSRLLFKGLQSFPELLRRFGEEEIGQVQRDTAGLLARLADGADGAGGASRGSVDGGSAAGEVDWSAIAVVLQGATAHYWLLADVFGEHPTGVDEERFVSALAAVAVAALGGATTPGQRGARDTAPRTSPKEKR